MHRKRLATALAVATATSLLVVSPAQAQNPLAKQEIKWQKCFDPAPPGAERSLQSCRSVTIAPEPVMMAPAKPSREGNGSPASTFTTTAASGSSPAATRIQCGKPRWRRMDATGWPVSRIRKGVFTAAKSTGPRGKTRGDRPRG